MRVYKYKIPSDSTYVFDDGTYVCGQTRSINILDA
jgi:hypothetical protein